ncbi:hypothetical protein [Aquibacillus saliphilus]|uniref:hypothetical protein n=1 Tax=Aquibacillus saliphilus TaxID=1909422 RepID=UPI001CF0AA97|nr:hypothetical protein [Aquibacillus saliphilus]
MKTRIGFVGNKELNSTLDSVAKEFTEVELTYYFYESEEEAYELVMGAQVREDIILFGGPVPYSMVKLDPRIIIPTTHISYDGAAFYKGLLNVIYNQKLPIEKISVDVISEETIKKIYRDLNIPISEVHVYPNFNGNGKEFLEFHEQLYNSGQTKSAITSVFSTHQLLKEKGIPSTLVLATESAIREGIQRAILEIRSLYFKKSQIAVGYIKIPVNEERSEYEIQTVHLELHRQLMLYAKELHADIFPLNRMEFVFYTTRGMLELNDLNFLQMVFSGLKKVFDKDIHIGLGYGKTAQIAGRNARKAIEYSVNMVGDQCFLIKDDSNLLNLFKNENKSFRTNDDYIQELAEQYSISSMVLKRINRALEKLGKNELTAEELADELNQTPRNTRRTLKLLVDKGLAIQIGEEHIGGKGRPKLLYEILLLSVRDLMTK